MIGIVDYGMGNIASVSNIFKSFGVEVCRTDSVELLERATHIILPGVGSFQAAVAEIDRRGLRDPILRLAQRKPILGICLGMQLLFTKGTEGKESFGLNLIPGTVEKIKTEMILPHIGWNTIDATDSEFSSYNNRFVYFVHSYYAKTDDKNVKATTHYGVKIPAIVRKENIYGMQFHPEKSGSNGKALISTFLQSTNINICS